jgi:hypothetical protein
LAVNDQFGVKRVHLHIAALIAPPKQIDLVQRSDGANPTSPRDFALLSSAQRHLWSLGWKFELGVRLLGHSESSFQDHREGEGQLLADPACNSDQSRRWLGRRRFSNAIYGRFLRATIHDNIDGL